MNKMENILRTTTVIMLHFHVKCEYCVSWNKIIFIRIRNENWRWHKTQCTFVHSVFDLELSFFRIWFVLFCFVLFFIPMVVSVSRPLLLRLLLILPLAFISILFNIDFCVKVNLFTFFALDLLNRFCSKILAYWIINAFFLFFFFFRCCCLFVHFVMMSLLLFLPDHRNTIQIAITLKAVSTSALLFNRNFSTNNGKKKIGNAKDDNRKILQ